MAEKKKIFMSRRLLPDVEARAARDYDLVLNEDDHVMSEAELSAACQDVDGAVICVTDKFSADVISSLPDRFKIVSTFSVGTDHIDLNAAKARGLRVGCAPNGVTIGTAEIAFLLILGCARRVHEGERLVRTAEWDGWGPMQLLGMCLAGKKLGIFGMGKIGQALAQRARGFDMDVHYHNRSQLCDGDAQGATYHATLDSLLQTVDVLSVNAPSTPQTRRCINADALGKMRKGAIVINTARGDLVHDEDMIAAVKSGHIGAVGLDVFDGEPAVNKGYLDLERAVLLPHLGSATWEGRTQMGFEALDNIDAIFAGKDLPFPVV